MPEHSSVDHIHRLRLDLSYDGTGFSGWAKQPGLRTVEGELEAALATLTRQSADEVRLIVGGRTDAGVHARGQVCHVDVMTSQLTRILSRQPREVLGTPESARRLNGVLSRRNARDVIVHRVSAVPDVFDARFSAVSRRYEYRLRPAGVKIDPLTRFFTVDVHSHLDLTDMQEASRALLGLRDFTTFCKARDGATAVRTLLRFDWRVTTEGIYVATVEADAFCHSMVRSLVGAVVAVGSGKVTLEELEMFLQARERTNRFTVMPAKGLSLEEILYAADDELLARSQQTRAKRVPLEAGQ